MYREHFYDFSSSLLCASPSPPPAAQENSACSVALRFSTFLNSQFTASIECE